MAKYGNGLRIKDVKRLEVKEAKAILKKYNISKEDRIAIIDMIEEAYYQFEKCCLYANHFEGYIMNKYPDIYKEYIGTLSANHYKAAFELEKELNN